MNLRRIVEVFVGFRFCFTRATADPLSEPCMPIYERTGGR